MHAQYEYITSDTTWNADAERRMSDLATFSDGLVHDIRNPLNVVRSNLYLLRQRLGTDDPRVVRALNRIDDQVTAELRHLEGIEAFYRTDRCAPQRVQLNDLVKAVLDTVTVPEGCELQSALAEDLPLVSADPQLVEAGLRALLRNALEAVPGGGTIRVSTVRTASGVDLVVEDDGEGLAPEVLARAFEPFYTTRRAHGGLGLALVAGIARAHGTTARIGSRAGEGTEATLALPLAEPAGRAPEPR